MASSKTTPAIISVDGYTDEVRAHPAGAFFENYHLTYDTGDLDKAFALHKSNFTYNKANGEVFNGSAAEQQLKQDYSVFTKYIHEPKTLILYDSIRVPGGWELVGTATVFANLVGQPDGGPKVTSRDGAEWEMAVPGTFHFTFEKDGETIKLAKSEIFSDSGPIVTKLLQRGVLKPADLGL